jgi:hypothetical protein
VRNTEESKAILKDTVAYLHNVTSLFPGATAAQSTSSPADVPKKSNSNQTPPNDGVQKQAQGLAGLLRRIAAVGRKDGQTILKSLSL